MTENKNKIIILLALVVALFLCIPVFAADKTTSLPTATQLWSKVDQINPGLKDYQAPIQVKVKAKYQFLNPTINLTGTYYYKKPDKHKLKLDKASYFLNKYPQIFGWNLPNLDEFNSTVELKTLEAREYYVVTLKPKTVVGDVDKEVLWIDKSDYTIPRHYYSYKKGGVINLTVKYRKADDKYLLFDQMIATFDFPSEKLQATANASYGTYKMNQGLSDDFFKD
jgi:outer membrane lipoprotein-sorting protein